jgi:hypothetical protein
MKMIMSSKEEKAKRKKILDDLKAANVEKFKTGLPVRSCMKELKISKAHRELVLKRIEMAKRIPGRMIPWDIASKMLKS